MFSADLRHRAEGSDLASVDEAHKDALSFGGSDPPEQRLHPFAAPRCGRTPIFEGENVGPEPVDQFLDHVGGFRIVRPSGGPEPPVDEVLRTFQNRESDASAEGIDGPILA